MSSFRWGIIAHLTPRNSQVADRELRQPLLSCLSSTVVPSSLKKHASTIFGSHTVTVLSRSGYHISFERRDPGLPKDTKNLIFLINRCSLSQVQNTSFQHGFLVCRPQPTSSTLWPVIQSNIAREHAIVSQMKDLIKAFHLNPNNQKFLV